MEEIKVKGMHCNACVSIIKMELEESGYGEDKVLDVSLDKDDYGKVKVKVADDKELDEVKSLINSINPDSYQVV